MRSSVPCLCLPCICLPCTRTCICTDTHLQSNCCVPDPGWTKEVANSNITAASNQESGVVVVKTQQVTS